MIVNGTDERADPFSGNSLGAYSNAATVDPESKTRSYAGSAFGIPAQQKPNVQIITEAQVQKILFSKTDSGAVRATGLQVVVDGKTQEFTAGKEVILAAGVFNTPKLLEISGVGNKEVLQQHDIPVIIDLPGVGENLQDHLMTGISYEVVEGVVTGDPLLRQEPEALATAQKLYFEHKAGPFTMGGIQSHAFMPTSDATEILNAHVRQPQRSEEQKQLDALRGILERPDATSGAWLMFLAQANLHQSSDGSGSSFVGSKLHPENFASLGCIQAHPFSRGSSHITSADASAPPTIDPRYFSHPADLEFFARHVRDLNTRLRVTEPLAKYLKPDGKRNHPDAFHVDDLEGAKKYALDTATSAYHQCGTAAMLPREQGGVVSPELVVYGTENLRVVDASIFPLIPRGNIMSSVYAVAEKAADIIKTRE